MSHKVVVGLSGGVDSSVAALLLKQQGYDVIGLFMKNWEEKDEHGQCTSTEDYEDVARVCEVLDIPFYGVNFAKEYWDSVFTECLEEFKQGYTPNPDILCNREIKFKVLFDKARELGGEYLATGHYCRTRNQDGEAQLLRGVDPQKDQSYFLYTVKSEILSHVLFPIGDMPKSEVREIARRHQIPVHAKKDSTGICFIGERNFKEFLGNYIPYTPGNFETAEGKIVGKHDGYPFYTVGQRRGLGIGGPGEPWFVVGKDVLRNVVIVEQGFDHPSLFSSELFADQLSWVSSRGESTIPRECTSKIRYRQVDMPCRIASIDEGVAHVLFPEKQRAVTPRQSVVFYDGEVCLGGGVIRG
jgi:tRNA-uridine 2-sulfurtransferase